MDSTISWVQLLGTFHRGPPVYLQGKEENHSALFFCFFFNCKMLRNFKTFSRFTEVRDPFYSSEIPSSQHSAWHIVGSQRLFVEYNLVVTSHLLYSHTLSFTCTYIHFRSSNSIRLMLWDSRWWKYMWPICENCRVRKRGPFPPRMKKGLHRKCAGRVVSEWHSLEVIGYAGKGRCWTNERARSLGQHA